MARPVHGTHVSRETFHLPDLWALHFYEYDGRLEIDDHTFDLHPGSVTLVPPGAVVTYYYEGPSQHLYCHFRCAAEAAKGTVSPAFFNADPRLEKLKKRLTEAMGFSQFMQLRANARLWDVLLALASHQTAPEEYAEPNPVMQTALQIADMEMASALTVAEMAKRCGVSHNHFIQIVQKHTGLTPRDWLKQRRVERARDLLAYSDLPIKLVAYEVGLPDLQHFNKVMRQHFGSAPRALRQRLRSRGMPT